jgi:glycyl-tRNA synthetase
VDGQSLSDQTVTLRDRDSLEQVRLPRDRVVAEIADRLRG